MHNSPVPAGRPGLHSLEGSLISRCGWSTQGRTMAAQGLTEGVINYGLLPVVMREKPTESSKDTFNTKVLILRENFAHSQY